MGGNPEYEVLCPVTLFLLWTVNKALPVPMSTETAHCEDGLTTNYGKQVQSSTDRGY